MSTSDKLSFFALGISVLTAIFSWYSFAKTDELSKNAFNRNYRPYLVAANAAYIDNKDGKFYPTMNVMSIQLFNGPALIRAKKLSFYIRDNAVDSLLFQHPISRDELLYPLERAQYSMNTSEKEISHELALKIAPKKIIRKTRIEYEWISDSSLNYYFESEWEYNIQKHDWDIISQSAN